MCPRATIDHKYYLAGYIIQGAFAILLLKNPEIILKEKERGNFDSNQLKRCLANIKNYLKYSFNFRHIFSS